MKMWIITDITNRPYLLVSPFKVKKPRKIRKDGPYWRYDPELFQTVSLSRKDYAWMEPMEIYDVTLNILGKKVKKCIVY